MSITNVVRSKGFLAGIITLFCLAALIGAFGVGELIGYRKAHFSYAWSEQYDRNFGGPRRGIFDLPGEPVFPNPHGIDGTVIKIESGSIIVLGRDRREKSVVLDDAQITDRLQLGNHVVIIGDPNENGQVVAKFIRILP